LFLLVNVWMGLTGVPGAHGSCFSTLFCALEVDGGSESDIICYS